MGWRFRRTFKVAPGIRWNLGKGGTSWSFGPGGFKFNVSNRGVRRTISIPGTGISHSQMLTSVEPDSLGNRQPRVLKSTEPASDLRLSAVSRSTTRETTFQNEAANDRQPSLMTAMLGRIFGFLKGLFTSQRSIYQPVADVFQYLDLDEVRRRLRAAERGRDNGSRESPPSDAAGPDYSEREIMAFFDEEQNRCLTNYDYQLRAYRESIGVLDSRTAAAQLAAERNRTVGNLSTLGVSGRNRLHADISRARSLSADLERFKVTNRISREARYPDSKLWYWGVLAVFVVIETGFNGYMFARGNPLGLLGGAFEATFFALANVTLGYCMGRFAIPNTQHAFVPRKLAGFIGTAAFVLLAFVFNFAVAHYRDAMALPPYEDVPSRALASLISSPFVLADLASWMLLGFGLIFNFGAAIDAWKMDDAYPGYGQLHRDYESAHQDYAGAVEEVYVEARDQRDAGLKRIQDVALQAGLNMNQQQALLSRSNHLRRKFEQHQEYLERCCQAVLGEYRLENERLRQTPPPKHFRSEYSMVKVDLPPVDPVSVSKEMETVMKSAQQAVADAYEEAVAGFSTVQTLTDGTAK